MMKKTLLFTFTFAATFLLLGELDFRWLPHEQKLSYEVHPILLWHLKPNQSGFEWLANMSQKSPSIHINQLGFRGDFEDLTSDALKILSVGSSSSLGTGVKEDEVWSYQLQKDLQSKNIQATVFNGANPGWGPFQHAAFLEEEVIIIKPHLIIVFISTQDLNFLPKTKESTIIFLKKEQARKQLLDVSPFITFSLRKAESLVKPTWQSFRMFIGSFIPNTEVQVNSPIDKITPHIPYWETMIRLSKENKIHLLFLIPDLSEDPLSIILSDTLKGLKNGSDPFYIIQMNQNAVSMSNLDIDDYLIPNDGHPNPRYHQLMAQFLSEHIENHIS